MWKKGKIYRGKNTENKWKLRGIVEELEWQSNRKEKETVKDYEEARWKLTEKKGHRNQTV